MTKQNIFLGWITPDDCEWKNCLRIFCMAGIICALIFLPFVILDKGVFLLYGDYNVQQIPFYQIAHDAIRNGNLGWNWNTDLGANFIGSYSFYLLGSPFFWITIPFPTSWLPYLMAPLFVLKFALAAVTGYALIRRFTKTPHMAFIGGLLYAFSGFMIYNIFYNHFHEVVVFFPLLLIGLEELVVNNRRGLFALAVACNLIINYYFFVAEVVFLVLYFTTRCLSKGFPITIRKFLFLALESVLGSLIGMALLLPSALMVLQNPRVSHMLTGFNMLFYPKEQKYGLILQSLFFPPDMPAFPNFFPDADAKWYSVAAYLPMFGMCGVLSFLRDKRNNWLKYLLLSLFVMMMIPFLNSMFNGFNSSFYTRWFYMLTLMMALATALALENPRVDMKFGIKFNMVVVLAFSVIGILPKTKDEQLIWGHLPNYPAMFWINVLIALGGVALTFFLCYRFRKNPKLFYRGSIVCLCGFILIYSVAQIAWGKSRTSPYTYNNIVEQGLNAEFDLEQDGFFRIDVYNDSYTDNWAMFWQLPSIQAFQSTVPASIMQFYPKMGISRDVASRIPAGEYDALREFLSVKYIFVENDEHHKQESPRLPPGFTFYQHQNGFDIYENQHFLPMGFCFDQYLTESDWNGVSEKQRDRLLLKGVVLTDDQVNKYSSFLSKLTNSSGLDHLTDADMLNDTDKLQQNSADSFAISNSGFQAEIHSSKESLALFTVPYESGWTATVNGEPVEIEQADFGFMAVAVGAGNNHIEFTYHTPGFAVALCITGGGIVLYLGYLIWNRRLTKKNPDLYAPRPYAHNQERRLEYTSPTNSQLRKYYYSRKNRKP